jgi:hypothetical protein
MEYVGAGKCTELWSQKFFGSSSRGLLEWGAANEPHLHHPAKAYLNVKHAALLR